MSRQSRSSKWAPLHPLQQKKAPACPPRLILCGLAFLGLLILALLAWTFATASNDIRELYWHQSKDDTKNPAQSPADTLQAGAVQTAQQGGESSTCGLPKPHLPKLPPWRPPPEKYLVAWCHLYGWSNRMYCTEKALVLAAAFNRTLIVPSIDVCVNTTAGNTMDLMIDVEHIRHCLLQGQLQEGKHTDKLPEQVDGEKDGEHLRRVGSFVESALGTGLYAVSLQEYFLLHSVSKLQVDLLMCEGHEWYGHCPPESCTAADQVVHPTAKDPPLMMYNSSEGLTAEKIQILAEATASAGVLSLGDTFYGSLDPYKLAEWASSAPLFQSPCGLILQPRRDIFALAQAFIADGLNNSEYAALHWRRKDFESHCKGRGQCVFWSIEQTAACLAEDMKAVNLTKLFVATDAYAHELRQLGGLLGASGIVLSVFVPQTRRSWFESSLVEKVICAHASLFIHQDKSTFSYHIMQMRDGLGKGNCRDASLCHGRKGDFKPKQISPSQ